MKFVVFKIQKPNNYRNYQNLSWLCQYYYIINHDSQLLMEIKKSHLNPLTPGGNKKRNENEFIVLFKIGTFLLKKVYNNVLSSDMN